MITFEKMLEWIRQQLKNLFGKNDVQISSDMETNISEWVKQYLQRANKDSLLELPAAISSEFAGW